MTRSLFERARQWGVRHLMDWAFDTKIDPTAHTMLIALPRGSVLDPLWPDGQIRVDGMKMPLHDAIYRQLSETPGRSSAKANDSGSEDPTLVEKLRALGYIE